MYNWIYELQYDLRPVSKFFFNSRNTSPSCMCAISVGRCMKITPQSSQRHVTASGSAFFADLSLSPGVGEPAGEPLYGSTRGSLRAESSLSSAEDSEKQGEIERGEREGLWRLRAMTVDGVCSDKGSLRFNIRCAVLPLVSHHRSTFTIVISNAYPLYFL